MADPAVTITQIDRISAADFNTGFNAIQSTISTEKQYYDDSGDSLAKTKNKLYNQFNNCAINGLLYKLTYGDRVAVISGGIVDGTYLQERVGFVYPDANDSLAYQYSDDFLTKSELAMKSFLSTINCVGTKTYCHSSRNLYSHKTTLASASYSQHTLSFSPADDNGGVTVYQTYITT